MSFGKLGAMGRGMGHLGSLGGTSALRGDAYGSFSAMADGTPTNAATGEPFLRETGGDANTVQATVQSGALVVTSQGAAGTGAYTGFRCREDIKSMYADVIFGNANDNAALISSMDVKLAAILASSAHIVISASTWAIQYFSAGSITTEFNGSFTQVDLNTRYRIGWRLVGDDFYLKLPNGTEIGPYTSAATASRTNHAAIFEHNRGVAGIPAIKFMAVAANLFANPTAAGRTNLFSAQNNLGNAAWTKTNYQAAVSGQADSDGGTSADKMLETAATGFHSIAQTLSKDATARRYGLRYKVKGVSRDAVHLLLGSGGAGMNQYFGLSSGTIPAGSGAFTDKYFMVYPLGNDWYQVQAEFKTGTETSDAIQFSASTGTSTGNASYAGDTAKGLIIFDQWLFERPV
jgi:hypothetical protein